MTIFPENIEVKYNLDLSKHSSFKIGGIADTCIFPKSSGELIQAVRLLQSAGERFEIIGNASNILFDDGGYRGTLIFTSGMNNVSFEKDGENTYVSAECGRKLTELAYLTLKTHGLRGLEFAYGIPGSVGGGVYMNAGAYGGEVSDIVIESTCYDKNRNEIVKLTHDEHGFSYRKSVFQSQKNLIILSTKLRLSDDDGSALSRALENMRSRKDKQPLEYPNAGSAFKRPEGYIAAKLIDECGLKGRTVGGAQVSCKHAGFFINTGRATCKDILALADTVKQKVFDNFGVELQLEIIYIPEK